MISHVWIKVISSHVRWRFYRFTTAWYTSKFYIKISENVLSIIRNFKMFPNLWLIVGDFRDNSVLLPSRTVSFNWFVRADFGNLRFSLHVRSDWLPVQNKSNSVTSI